MKIVVESSALPYQLTQEIIKEFPNFKVIKDYQDYNWELARDEELINLGKKILFILNFKGNFLKSCPGTKNYICCGYQIFHLGEGCPLDCSYCILQLYLNRPGLKIWGNLIEEGFKELKNFLKERKKQKKVVRIGTGEFTDSLALENITHISERLIHFWEEEDPLGVLELKTKIALQEEFFKKLKGNSRVIFAWSVNTEEIINREEKGTAPLLARIESAQRAINYGFTVAFHFDPLILHPSSYENYPKVLEKILQSIPSDKIAWISFGTLRFPKALKEIAQKRFPSTKIYTEEFIEGLDQKNRYFIDERKKLYSSLGKLIKETKDIITYYFCMESERIWEEVLGEKIYTSEKLAEKLDKVALKLCS